MVSGEDSWLAGAAVSLCPHHLLLACAPAWGQRETETPLPGDADSLGPWSPPVTSFRLYYLLKHLSPNAVTLGSGLQHRGVGNSAALGGGEGGLAHIEMQSEEAGTRVWWGQSLVIARRRAKASRGDCPRGVEKTFCPVGRSRDGEGPRRQSLLA